MSAFDVLCPVRTMSNEKLVTLARKYWPLSLRMSRAPEPLAAQAFVLDPQDIVRDSYLYPKKGPSKILACLNKDEPLPNGGLEIVGELKTFHAFADYRYFKPRAAEVLLQIKDKAMALEKEGFAVFGYESLFPCFEKRAQNFLLVRRTKGKAELLPFAEAGHGLQKGDALVQIALTRLYALGPHVTDPQVSHRPLKCRGILYAPTRPLNISDARTAPSSPIYS